MKNSFLALVCLFLVLASCKKEETPEPDPTPINPTTTLSYRPGAGVTDVDGNNYKTVIIKFSTSTNKNIVEQEWMMENLRTKKNPDGSEIDPFFVTKMSYCNNDSTTVDSLGILYTWDALMNNTTVASSQGVCPNGWHIPTIGEFNTLINGLGGNATAGKKMKSTNATYWNDITKSDNTSGFNAQGTGWAMGQGMVVHYLNATMFWTSTEDGSDAKIIQLNSHEVGVFNQYGSSKSTKVSCRCIKN
jgi:uncharacterized protein (TIGR02145 family)